MFLDDVSHTNQLQRVLTFALLDTVPDVSILTHTLTDAVFQSTHTGGVAPLVHTEILEYRLSVSSNTLFRGGAVIRHNDCVQLKSHKQKVMVIKLNFIFAIHCRGQLIGLPRQIFCVH